MVSTGVGFEGARPTVGQVDVIGRIVVAALLAASATDSLLASHPVVFPGHTGRVPTAGTLLAWDRESSTRGSLHDQGIALKVCLPLVALGITAISSSTLMVELGARVVFGAAAIPELLAPSIMRGLKRASIVSAIWFVVMAMWIWVAATRGAPPAPTRGRVRTSAIVGWAIAASAAMIPSR
jgi:hypothetical protein